MWIGSKAKVANSVSASWLVYWAIRNAIKGCPRYCNQKYQNKYIFQIENEIINSRKTGDLKGIIATQKRNSGNFVLGQQ